MYLEQSFNLVADQIDYTVMCIDLNDHEKQKHWCGMTAQSVNARASAKWEVNIWWNSMKAAFAVFTEHTFVGKWSSPGRFAGCRWWRPGLVLPASLRLLRPPPPSPARWSPGRSWSSPRRAARRRASVCACVSVQPVLRPSKSQSNPISDEHELLLSHSRAAEFWAETAAASASAVAAFRLAQAWRGMLSRNAPLRLKQ